MAEHPVVNFCPYLPLEKPLAVGPWRVAPLKSFDGPWQSSTFEELARQLIEAHHDVHGHKLGNPAVVVHEKHGAHGKAPRQDILERLQMVLDLAVLSANPEWHAEAQGHSVATTDNSKILVWPIDVTSEHKSVAVRRGLIVQMLTGGYEINSTLRIQPPEALHVPSLNLRLDDDELYRHLWKFFSATTDLVARVKLSTHWLSKAWQNSTAVQWDDRIVFLKTGFEALLAQDGRKREEGKALRNLFEAAYQGAHTWEVEGLLWSLKERPTLRWRDKRWSPTKPSDQVTPLQRWYLNFAEQRNALIHDGAIQSFVYNRKGYKGPHFFIGSRVLLEAIRTVVGQQVGVRLALKPKDRNKLADYKKLAALLTKAHGSS